MLQIEQIFYAKCCFIFPYKVFGKGFRENFFGGKVFPENSIELTLK